MTLPENEPLNRQYEEYRESIENRERLEPASAVLWWIIRTVHFWARIILGEKAMEMRPAAVGMAVRERFQGIRGFGLRVAAFILGKTCGGLAALLARLNQFPDA